jgi:hypothetical protein
MNKSDILAESVYIFSVHNFFSLQVPSILSQRPATQSKTGLGPHYLKKSTNRIITACIKLHAGVLLVSFSYPEYVGENFLRKAR